MWQTCKTTAFILCLFISAYNIVVNLSLTTFLPVLWFLERVGVVMFIVIGLEIPKWMCFCFHLHFVFLLIVTL